MVYQHDFLLLVLVIHRLHPNLQIKLENQD